MPATKSSAPKSSSKEGFAGLEYVPTLDRLLAKTTVQMRVSKRGAEKFRSAILWYRGLMSKIGEI